LPERLFRRRHKSGLNKNLVSTHLKSNQNCQKGQLKADNTYYGAMTLSLITLRIKTLNLATLSITILIATVRRFEIAVSLSACQNVCGN
jgi:hypothetical protein